MAASVQFSHYERDLGMVMREVDENLAIFLGIKNIESKGVDPKPERIEPVDSNYFLDSEIDAKGYDWHIAQSLNEFAKTPIEFSCREADSRKIELPNDAGESASVLKRRPLPLTGDQKPTSRAPTPTGQRPIKPKPSRASTPAPTRAAFPSSKTTQASSKPRSSIVSRGTFQTVKSRPSKASETQITKMSTSVDKPRQNSCSPAKTRVPNGNAVAKDGNIVMPKVRGYSNGCGDDVNPVVIGSKMVERIVNMRKLAPPKQDNDDINAKKSSSLANSGFGRSLSKNSLDMAIRHMGIKGSIHDGLSPVTTGLSSSTRGIRSSSSKNSTVSVPESPVTSSSESSKSSNVANSYFLDGRYMDY